MTAATDSNSATAAALSAPAGWGRMLAALLVLGAALLLAAGI